MKSGFVTLLGRPNSGKSTLINMLLDQKIVIVSDKPQTTWHRINCIFTDESSQIVFTDTPGIHKVVNNVNRYMMKAVGEALEGIDLMLWLIDCTKGLSKGEDYVYDKIKIVSKPYIILLNKIDLMKQDKVEHYKSLLQKKYQPDLILPICAKDCQHRDGLISSIKDYLSEGSFMYPPDMITDRSNKFIVSEIIREKIFRITYEEIPYSCAVYVEHFSDNENGKLNIRAEIWVERKTQKGMIIGKDANTIKKIRLSSKKDIQYLFDRPTDLELFVKIKKDWRQKDYLLNEDLHFS
ncbi:MAG TPA: GTPase Era [Bacteroidales bacterium]|nr:GTPase Era [Bacteroidales bacterium]HRW33687.1 GTPase Era [Thermotogota bacterium]